MQFGKFLSKFADRLDKEFPIELGRFWGGRVFYRKTEIFQTFMAANRCAISQKSLCVWDIYLPSLNTRDTKWKSTYKLGVLSIRIFAAFIHSAHDSVSPPLLAILFAVRTLFPQKSDMTKLCVYFVYGFSPMSSWKKVCCHTEWRMASKTPLPWLPLCVQLLLRKTQQICLWVFTGWE